MAVTCPIFVPSEEFLAGTLAAVDCYAQNLGEGGYQALAAPGSPVSLALTGLLTIFVALFGYRMLFGQMPDARDGVVAIAKVGIVLALATSWPAFRTLAYDVSMRGPAELAAAIGRPTGLPGTDGGLVARLQGVDNMLSELNLIGTGRPPWVDGGDVGPQNLTPEQRQERARFEQMQQRPRWDPERDAKMVSQARTLFLTGAIGAFAAVRLVAGLLLALGPLFALFLLFDGTRGLFEGWLRVLAGAALGALATGIVLAVELALVEPWLAVVIAERRAGLATPRVPVELLVITLVFALALLAMLIATARVARGFRIPQALRLAPSQIAQALHGGSDMRTSIAVSNAAPAAVDERSRAAAVADAVSATQRREAFAPPLPATRLGGEAGAAGAPGSAAAATRSREAVSAAAAIAGGEGSRRRTRGRVSAGAQRRDSRR